MPTHYEILGCDKSASYQEIRKCYLEQVKKCHPDKSSDKSEEEFFALNKAWNILRKIESRREYDLEISRNDVSETPLYCEVGLSDMDYDLNANKYSYRCRCGGLYVVNASELCDVNIMKIPCDECTFHIDVFIGK